ncbi:uncharacterized protein LOC121412572 isoform X1 [Lytechinus variegatus]|uniref:uncharacterized protein LOC121412572 isoform X1 n=1 Tax=Lytechinus variegatus TaxID=7654 RepID=UPI001BB13F93|nr:uncharacterized protein LOC121412572 isoform X1 [Lytechinus variegatus]
MAENGSTPLQRRIFLACVPRSMSTSLLKCLSVVDDDHVAWFEPYISSYFPLIEYKNLTGQKLPVDYEGNEKEYEKAAVFIENQDVDIDVNDLSNLPGPSCDPRMLSYPEVKKCLDNASSRLVIVKDFGLAVDGYYQYLPSVESGYKYVFLIRDPLLAAMSYRRAVVAFNKKHEGLVDDTTFDLSDDKFYPGGGQAFRRQHAFWRHVQANIDPNPLIIDSDDLVAHPAACVKKICEVTGLEYSDALLKWEPASSGKDWMNYANTSMGQLMKSGLLCDFHTRAMQSTGFIATSRKKVDYSEEMYNGQRITPDVRRIVEKALKYYQEMYECRFTPNV